MTGSTIAQQILSSRSEDENPEPGDHVTVEPDWILAHDLSAYPGKRRWRELGFDEVARSENVVIVFDHHVPSKSDTVTDNMNEVEAWVKKHDIEHFFPAGNGISHNVLVENGYSTPGSLILGSDSHTTTHGALGAFASGIGHTDLGELFGTGELWVRIPESRKVVVEGELPDGVGAKDLALKLMGRLTAKGAIYESVEFHGEGAAALDVHERQTLSNLSVELGAMAGIVRPDDTVEEFLEDRAIRDYEAVTPDPDAEYVAEHRIGAESVEPLLAKPSRVDNIGPVADSVGTDVDQVFLGSCNNSSYDDIAAFVSRLEGERVASGTDLIVVPGSRATLERMNETGVSNTILEAGGMIGTPGCGPCFGAHGGVLGEGDVCVSTMNRNFPGRMGPGEIYLGSPQTAAAAAVYGEITDPREVT